MAVFPRDVVSCPAAVSRVLLLAALCSPCNIEQGAWVLLTNIWTKPEQSSPALAQGRETPSPLPLIRSVFGSPQHLLQCLLHLQTKSISHTSSLPILKPGSPGEDDSGEHEMAHAGSSQ